MHRNNLTNLNTIEIKRMPTFIHDVQFFSQEKKIEQPHAYTQFFLSQLHRFSGVWIKQDFLLYWIEISTAESCRKNGLWNSPQTNQKFCANSFCDLGSHRNQHEKSVPRAFAYNFFSAIDSSFILQHFQPYTISFLLFKLKSKVNRLESIQLS